MAYTLIHGDCIDAMRAMSTDSVDMIITSPPYTDQRTYGIGFKLSGRGWVDWCIPRVVEMCRVTAGIVFFNAAGPVRDFRYQPVVEWLVADLTRHHGIVCGPAPYVFHRVGIPGSGGPHYHRRDWEPIYCFAKPESLPPRWSDNTATGHPPKWAPGGEMSHRLGETRKNAFGVDTTRSIGTRAGGDRGKGENAAGETYRAKPPHFLANGKGITSDKDGRPRAKPRTREEKLAMGAKPHTKRDAAGQRDQAYLPPVLANSGNRIMETYTAAEVEKFIGEAHDVRQLKVGGGVMGDNICHESEAPFSEALVRFFIVSYCPPGGTVLDPFCGSGTTVSVAIQENRKAIGIDIRDGKGGLASARKRLANVTPSGLFGDDAA